MASSDTLLAEFDQEMGNTRKLLAALHLTIESWNSHEKSMDFRRLAGHVAELPGWAVETINFDSLDITPEARAEDPAHDWAGSDQVLGIFDGHLARRRAAIAGLILAKLWSLILVGKRVFKTSGHVKDHGDQSPHPSWGAARRLYGPKNIAIPGMYGPSAGEVNPFAAGNYAVLPGGFAESTAAGSLRGHTEIILETFSEFAGKFKNAPLR